MCITGLIARMQITIQAGRISIFHGTCNNIEDFRTICRLVDLAKPYTKVIKIKDEN